MENPPAGAFLKNPRISVALCTYNGEKYLEIQLASILAQTYPPYELIISDDHSTDGTLLLLDKVCEDAEFPVRIIRSLDVNRGVKNNFEKAIKACSGDYIALCDQDDVWRKEKLSLFSNAIIESNRSVPTLFYSDLDLISARGESLAETFFSRTKVYPPDSDCWKHLVVGNFAPGCSTVFDARLVNSILPFPSQSIIHDWWINLVFSLCGSVCRVESPTMFYRLHDGNNQGIGTFRKMLSAGSKYGYLTTAVGNLVAVIKQAESMLNRLRSEGLDYPCQLEQFLKVFEIKCIFRPFRLYRLGIGRGNTRKTVTMLVASIFVSSSQFERDESSYR